MPFTVVGEITEAETIALGRGIRELRRLRRIYGVGRWRKIKGIAKVRLPNGVLVTGEVHWYEAHGIARVELKIKRIIASHYES